MPVKKVHVKGKRKAPLPPTTPLNSLSNPSVARDNGENEKKTSNFDENSYTKDSYLSNNNNNKRMKAKAAPPPPLPTKIDRHDELNDFSLYSINGFKEITNNSESYNLNIFEPIQGDLEMVKKQNIGKKSDEMADSTLNIITPNNRDNDQIWICKYCTLRNPFWKIVCDACEQIKPYNTPNIFMSSALDVNYIKTAPQKDNFDILAPAKMRTKTVNVYKDAENILKRKSMKIDSLNNMKMRIEKKVVNRPFSMCSPNKISSNAQESLEAEKERIRELIRAMNTRATAKKLPIENDRLKTDAEPKSGAIRKHCGYQEHKLSNNKFSASNVIHLPLTDEGIYENYLSQTDDSKASLNLIKQNKISKKASRTKKDSPSGLIGQTNLGCSSKISDKSLKDESHWISRPMDEFTINVYVNFNKAVEVKVNHRMTLTEFEDFVSKNVAPSECRKIYFNGMLLRNGNQKLFSYGIKDRSSLYINTENVVAHTRSEFILPNNIFNERVERVPMKREAPEEIDTTVHFAQTNHNHGAKEKYLIEHIQYEKLLVERIKPKSSNLSKTKYRGVYNYNPRCNPDLRRILNTNKSDNNDNNKNINVSEMRMERMFIENQQMSIAGTGDKINQYMQLLSIDDSMDLTKNTEQFECSICLIEYEPFQAIILRNCLHTFCKECLRNSIIYSDESEIKCPYIDEQYSCAYFLQDREIKALLTKTEFDNHLAKSLRIAENQIENSFHCRTPNCKGWCIYEDDVNAFKCPICKLENCLTCRVIHDGLDCKQYQTMMKNNDDDNPEHATTVKLLEEMVKNDEAMNCPTCKIVLMKKWGCDWLKCSMCKTEICWITRGPRWGPGGKGDTSAGCRCGVDGFRCHPKCTYCH